MYHVTIYFYSWIEHVNTHAHHMYTMWTSYDYHITLTLILYLLCTYEIMKTNICRYHDNIILISQIYDHVLSPTTHVALFVYNTDEHIRYIIMHNVTIMFVLHVHYMASFKLHLEYTEMTWYIPFQHHDVTVVSFYSSRGINCV